MRVLGRNLGGISAPVMLEDISVVSAKSTVGISQRVQSSLLDGHVGIL